MSILIAVLIFGVIVVIHEFGHFIAARKNGIFVEEFAIGMGPKLVSKKIGETVWSIRALPIGGFCKMLGEDEENLDPRAFNSKKVWQRIIVIAAGVVMNIALAVLITVGISLFSEFTVPVIGEIVEDSPAEKVGLRPGDRFLKINGASINIYPDVKFVMEGVNGTPIDISVDRNGEKLSFTITPQLTTQNGKEGYIIGFRADWRTSVFGEAIEGYQRATILESFKNGFFTSVYYVKSTFIGFTRLITMRLSVDQMAGPIGIVSFIGDTYEEASEAGGTALVVRSMLNFMAFLSANLAVVNLLPLPALDGGRLVFLIIEGIRRKPVDPNKEGMIHFAGFVLLMLFAVFIAYQDIVKLL